MHEVILKTYSENQNEEGQKAVMWGEQNSLQSHIELRVERGFLRLVFTHENPEHTFLSI